MIHVREANLSDVSKLAKVHVDTWKTTYQGIVPQDYLDNLSYKEREERWIRILTDTESIKSNKSLTLVAEVDNEIVAFASYGKERSKDPKYDGEIYSIYVLREWQKKGIGRRLIKEVARNMIKDGFVSLLIWVLVENPSRGFYESLGGKLIHTKPIAIGGTELEEVAYGWSRIDEVLKKSEL